MSIPDDIQQKGPTSSEEVTKSTMSEQPKKRRRAQGRGVVEGSKESRVRDVEFGTSSSGRGRREGAGDEGRDWTSYGVVMSPWTALEPAAITYREKQVTSFHRNRAANDDEKKNTNNNDKNDESHANTPPPP